MDCLSADRAWIWHHNARLSGHEPTPDDAYVVPVHPGLRWLLHLLLRVPPERGAVRGQPAGVRHDCRVHRPEHRGGTRLVHGRVGIPPLRAALRVRLPRRRLAWQPGAAALRHREPDGVRALARGQDTWQQRKGTYAVPPSDRLETAQEVAPEQAHDIGGAPDCHVSSCEGICRGDSTFPCRSPLGFRSDDDWPALLGHRPGLYRISIRCWPRLGSDSRIQNCLRCGLAYRIGHIGL
mmetsp:Transcript_33035/g.94408  ORF Transcript_33035/g.94408 Transcript_33035/m.94408 type:complete len:237 (+) Transcript_33035:420-1130(+)